MGVPSRVCVCVNVGERAVRAETPPRLPVLLVRARAPFSFHSVCLSCCCCWAADAPCLHGSHVDVDVGQGTRTDTHTHTHARVNSLDKKCRWVCRCVCVHGGGATGPLVTAHHHDNGDRQRLPRETLTHCCVNGGRQQRCSGLTKRSAHKEEESVCVDA